ncbi:MAG: anhydro-N-acetylmuramic acid kinase [Bdellovibrionales bacterium]
MGIVSKLLKKKKWNILGVMNGTSLDGIDFVLCSYQRKTGVFKTKKMNSARFPSGLKEKLKLAATDSLLVSELSLLNYELGRFYSKYIAKLKNVGWKIDLVGLHGQTIFHKGRVASFQLGESSFIAKENLIPVVSDFRSGDIASGGEGAPLAGLFHIYLAKEFCKNKSVSFHNLGGISNITFISKKINTSFDTGPANMLVDLFLQKQSLGKVKFDKGGGLAKEGVVHQEILMDFMKHSFLKKKPNKSCGREEFGEVFLNKYYDILRDMELKDAVATLSMFTVDSIVEAYRKHLKDLPSEVYFSGGGTKNLFFLEEIQKKLPEVRVLTSENLGIDSQAMEASCFAYLAAMNLEENKLPTPDFTGANYATVLGKLSV